MHANDTAHRRPIKELSEAHNDQTGSERHLSIAKQKGQAAVD